MSVLLVKLHFPLPKKRLIFNCLFIIINIILYLFMNWLFLSFQQIHCRHCGQIFCQACLAHVVNSGPKQRPSRVCGVCHTLLVPETAPYFSQKPPHIPD